MLFLATFLSLMLFHSIMLVIATTQHRHAQSLIRIILMLVGAIAAIAATGLDIDPEKGIAGDAINWCVWLFLIFALGTIISPVHELYSIVNSKNTNASANQSTRPIVVLVASLYLLFTLADHFLFFYQDRENTGVINLSLVKASDVSCTGMAIAWIRNDAIVYRCPKNIAFGSLYNAPFIPWPSYTEHISHELKGAFDAIKARAAKPNSTH